MPEKGISPIDVLYNPELGECKTELCPTFNNPNGVGTLCPSCVNKGVDRDELGKVPEDYADDFPEQTVFIPDVIKGGKFVDVEVLKSPYNFTLGCFECGEEWRHTNHPECESPNVVPDSMLVCPACDSTAVMSSVESESDE